ncbi:MAG: pectin esterase [Prevotella sp.]|nr:pectin esterase [Prevotella sp.]
MVQVRKSLSYLLIIAAVIMTLAAKKSVTVFLIGDSTMANKSIDNDKQERGWGMALQGFFKENIHVDNHAVNGRSSKSFIEEGRWEKVKDLIKPGDYVFIQFGHNDEKPQPERHTEPGGSFDENLRKFVNETREKGGIPVLFNCVARRNFYKVVPINDDDEKLRDATYSNDTIESDTLFDTHGEYRLAPKRVATEMKVPFIDANAITHNLEQGMGRDASKKLHMWFRPGEHPSIPDGRQDNTHYCVYGAHVVAGLLADAIGEKVPELRPYIVHYDFVVAENGFGNYMSLQKAIDEAPVGKTTAIRVLNGSWPKPVVDKNKKIKIYCDSQATIKD